jgi:hypothetical protein
MPGKVRAFSPVKSIKGSGKKIAFPLILTLSPIGGEGIEKEFF